MLSFFQKPYRFAMCAILLLSGLFAWSLLDVYIIPEAPVQEMEYETIDFSRFTRPAEPETYGEPSDETFPGGSIVTLYPVESSPAEPGREDTDIPDTEAPTEAPDYPIITESSYLDEHISITITTIRRFDSDIHVAEVILDSPEYLKTALANGQFGYNIKEKTSEQAKRVEAILAVNGDFYGANREGYVIRNGTLYRDSIRDTRFEDLAILYDGSFKTFYEWDITPRELLHKEGAMQILAFGPTLLKNREIVVGEKTEVGVASPNGNPRTVIGLVEPCHYFIVVADGRTPQSYGPTLYQMAQVMKELGCVTAYNLDGGGSATMYFNGKLVNHPTTDGEPHERKVSDIVYVGY